MKNTIKELLVKIESKGFEQPFFYIPEDLVVFIQKELSLKGKSDDELYELWFDVSQANDELRYDFPQLVYKFGMTILNVINGSKSFNQGILY